MDAEGGRQRNEWKEVSDLESREVKNGKEKSGSRE